MYLPSEIPHKPSVAGPNGGEKPIIGSPGDKAGWGPSLGVDLAVHDQAGIDAHHHVRRA